MLLPFQSRRYMYTPDSSSAAVSCPMIARGREIYEAPRRILLGVNHPPWHAALREHTLTSVVLREPLVQIFRRSDITLPQRPAPENIDIVHRDSPILRYMRKAPFRGLVCGEGGIRTHGTLSRTHTFQACQFSHSCTSPGLIRYPPFLPAAAMARIPIYDFFEFCKNRGGRSRGTIEDILVF